MSAALLAARAVLALVFVLAGVLKLTDRAGFRETLGEFGAPPSTIAVGALLLPVAEIAVGALLLPVGTAVAAAVAALVLLATFTAATGRLLARGESPDCGCLGSRPSPVGRSTVIRNGVLAAAAAVIAVGGPGESLAAALADADRSPLLVALAAAVLAQGWFCWALLRRHGRVVKRLRALEAASAPAPAVSAPDVRIPVHHVPAARPRVRLAPPDSPPAVLDRPVAAIR